MINGKALNFAIQEAETKQCKYVMATDPDADRFICAEKDGEQVNETHFIDVQWHVFKGDEIGALFGYYMCKTHPDVKGCLVNSVVSSQLLVKIAQVFHMHCEQTLTGFKWMGNKQHQLEQEGYQPLLTYEEAIGYAIGGILRDKDGVSATAKMCEIIAGLHQSNKTLLSLLKEMQVYDLLDKVVMPHVDISLHAIVMSSLTTRFILIVFLKHYVITGIICI